jgi:hypothetical protein
MKAKVIDPVWKKYYLKEMYVLWISKEGFYCLGFDQNQIMADLYVGKKQIELI